MKKHILLLVILLVPWTLSAQSLHGNYISTQLPISSADTLTTIEYFDGLGRSRETVKKGFSSNGNKDLLALTEYDGMDNKYRCWNSVPFPSTGEEVWATNTTRLAEKPMATQLYSPNMSLRENRTEELLRKQDLAIYGQRSESQKTFNMREI